jgi:hypothetical protein
MSDIVIKFSYGCKNIIFAVMAIIQADFVSLGEKYAQTEFAELTDFLKFGSYSAVNEYFSSFCSV